MSDSGGVVETSRENDTLVSTISELRRTLLKLEKQALIEECSMEGKGKSVAKTNDGTKIIPCKYPHDTIAASTDRGLVGVIQEKNSSKTKEQRVRAN